MLLRYHMLSFVIVAFVSAVVTSSDPATSFAQDKVYPASGTTLSGEISSISPDEVVISVKGKTQSVPTNSILRVVFNNEPAAFTRAKEFASQGQWEQADEEFKSIDAKTIEADAVKQEYLYYRSLIPAQLALAGKGNPAGPVAGLVSYRKSNPKSHHLYELCEVVGSVAVTMNAFPVAKEYFSNIANAPFPEYKIKSAYLVGTVALAEGKADEAKAEFEKVKSATATDPVSQRYQKLATVASIKTDIAKGNAKAAVDQLLKLAESSDSADSALFANIYNTLGEAHLALSEPNNAKLAYLATDMLFSSDAEKHAEALYHLAKLWEETGEPQRAVDARTRLKEQYAGTVWAKK